MSRQFFQRLGARFVSWWRLWWRVTWERRGSKAGERGSLGFRSERVAEKYLKRRRLKLIERNYEDTWGEIDLIMVDGRTVVFVEVKARESLDAGAGYEAIDDDKERRLTKTALGFLTQHELLECAFRFDIVSIFWPEGAAQPEIEYFENAFSPAEDDHLFA